MSACMREAYVWICDNANRLVLELRTKVRGRSAPVRGRGRPPHYSVRLHCLWFGGPQGHGALPNGRGSVSPAKSTRLLPSRDREGAVSPERLERPELRKLTPGPLFCDTVEFHSVLEANNVDGGPWPDRNEGTDRRNRSGRRHGEDGQRGAHRQGIHRRRIRRGQRARRRGRR